MKQCKNITIDKDLEPPIYDFHVFFYDDLDNEDELKEHSNLTAEDRTNIDMALLFGYYFSTIKPA